MRKNPCIFLYTATFIDGVLYDLLSLNEVEATPSLLTNLEGWATL